LKLFLIGLPGAGKSTLGGELARCFSVPFIDLDHEISQVAGISIPEIFHNQGEVSFRQLEADVLRKFTQDSFVMATGGGTPCFHENMEYMNSTGITVFLDVPPDRIVKRLMEAGDAGRPLLAVQNEDELRNRIHELWVSRLPYYQQASVQISAESVKPEEIQKIIMNYLKK
jgi:shikimate kinase